MTNTERILQTCNSRQHNSTTAQQHAAAVSWVVVGLLCASLKDDESAEAAAL
jgi:hypothetical protein